MGWINFNPTNGNVSVTDTALTGYIWSANYGWINLNPTNGGVINTNGTLSGKAWGTNTGWIDFTGVSIDSSGKFIGQTSVSQVGTITFSCTNCLVTTAWRLGTATSTATSTGSSGSSGGGLSGGFASGRSVTFLKGNVIPTASSSQPITVKKNDVVVSVPTLNTTSQLSIATTTISATHSTGGGH